jgi:outer membrane protein
VMGSEFNRKSARAQFFPAWTGQYGYTYFSDPVTLGSTTTPAAQTPAASSASTSATTRPVVVLPATTRDVYNFNTSLNQILYSGGGISANYRFQKLGLEISKTNVESVKQDIVLQVREGYFTILRTEKFVDVAKQAVKQFEGQLQISQAFFEVGLIPKNDVLQAEVNLANAVQAQAKAENDVALAKSSFNSLLWREINTPFEVVDILDYKPFPLTFEQSLDEALRQRPELKVAGLNIDQAKENVKITQAPMFPTVNLSGNYFKNSNEFYLSGDLYSEKWNINALATFTIWEWGKTYYQVGASKVKVTQAEDVKNQLKNSITLEVKTDYLNMLVSEKNINTAVKAIEQAEENLRLYEERYKYQVATAFDVINAVTLLAQARVNYYGALSDFNIAQAMLERSMGRM